MDEGLHPFWSIPQDKLLGQLETSPRGLTSNQVQQRLALGGKNSLKPQRRHPTLRLLVSQFTSPIILILMFAAGLSLFLHDSTDAVIILAIVLVSGLLGFWQERGAANAVAKLLALVQVKATVLRDGHAQDIPIEEVLVGDIVVLDAGDVIPGDCQLLESKDLSRRKKRGCACIGDCACCAHQRRMDGDACGQRRGQGGGRPYRTRDRVWKGQ
jgi:Mg2+-importing ATPase